MTTTPRELERKVVQLDNDVHALYELVTGISLTQVRHGNRLDELATTLDQHSDTLESHSATLAEHTTVLAEHTTTLAEHTATLAEHTATLAEHGSMLRGLTDSMAEVLRRLPG